MKIRCLMKFDIFVLPFMTGLLFLLALFVYKAGKWIYYLSPEEKKLLKKGILTIKSFSAAWEVFMESLLHRKIFRVNPLLGYMHMSLAFGWFCLIVFGNLESRLYFPTELNPPFYPIFLNFFLHDSSEFWFTYVFKFLMDFFLIIVLSGVLIAVIKRFYSRIVGLKQTTKLRPGDKFALASLWLIFPLRLLAESMAAAEHQNGGFLTNNLGSALASLIPVQPTAYISWWAYSLALGIFFFSLPFSRYMHIPTEIVLIFLRKYGIDNKKCFTSFSDIEVHSCSRCGICIDVCQVHSSTELSRMQPVYLLRNIRDKMADDYASFNCLVCGRCEMICPVAISVNDQRLIQRSRFIPMQYNHFKYLTPKPVEKAKVIYFAGCMTHLTPGIKNSVEKLLKKASVNYLFLDMDGSVCCGRPLMLAGMFDKANELISTNKNNIQASGAKILVTSCPICLKVFRDEYNLSIEVLHHSQYLLKLVNDGRLKLGKSQIKVAYHDPCELGRGCGIYNQPRQLLKSVAELVSLPYEKEKALCCGGSLGGFRLPNDEKDKIAIDAIHSLCSNNPDILVTACPLCKKTFAKQDIIMVKDLAEVLLLSDDKDRHGSFEIPVSNKALVV